MSIIDRVRQHWWMLVVGVLALGVIAVGAVFVATRQDTAAPPPRNIKHARWKIRTFPAGAIGRINKADRKRVKKQRDAVSETVRDVYESLFLAPGDTSADGRALSRSAQRALKHTKVGLPHRAQSVRVRRQIARIGIDVSRARRAAAAVKIVATAKLDQKRFRLVHRSKLWLERPRSRWYVIGYQMEQRRLK